jgi:hypothetical protein
MSAGMPRGGQPWMPPGGCQTNYGPVGPETYRFANSVPAPQYNHSIGPCPSPSSRSDHSNASIPPDRFQVRPAIEKLLATKPAIHGEFYLFQLKVASSVRQN